MNYKIVIEQTKDQGFYAYCPAIDFGTYGISVEASLASMTTHLVCYLHDPDATFEIAAKDHTPIVLPLDHFKQQATRFMGVVLAVVCLLFGQGYTADTASQPKTDAQVRADAVRALAKDASPRAASQLVGQLKTETNGRVKIQIIEALTLHQSTTTRAAVIAMLNDKNPQVRQSALINLAYFGVDTAAVEKIRASLETETDENTQLAGLNTLAVYKTSGSVEALDAVAARKNVSARVRNNASRLLEKSRSKDAQDRMRKYPRKQ